MDGGLIHVLHLICGNEQHDVFLTLM